MHKECPICGRPFSTLDLVLADREVGFQCHHCWNRVHATGPVSSPLAQTQTRRPILKTRRAGSRRRKV